jgi:hypothetical protein
MLSVRLLHCNHLVKELVVKQDAVHKSESPLQQMCSVGANRGKGEGLSSLLLGG